MSAQALVKISGNHYNCACICNIYGSSKGNIVKINGSETELNENIHDMLYVSS